MKYELLKRIEFQDDSIELSDLAIIEEVGQGSFGHVFLAAHKDKRTLYALKTISRRKIA